MARICGFAEDFEASLGKLDRQPRDQALKTIQKFEMKDTLPGLRLEKLGGHANLWSIRVNDSYRILMSKHLDAAGDFWVLENIGTHDVYRRR